jgi:hypothetical protein
MIDYPDDSEVNVSWLGQELGGGASVLDAKWPVDNFNADLWSSFCPFVPKAAFPIIRAHAFYALYGKRRKHQDSVA